MACEVKIHELHHHVLRAWNILREKRPSVICFDHHLDILPAFLRSGTPGEAGKDLEKDIEFLQHDEHFDYALKYGMISEAVIISHTPVVTAIPENLRVLYDGDFAEDEPLNSERFKQYCDRALEDDFLEKFLPYLPQKNYILDIDCDYFKTERSLAPSKSTVFREIVRNASMITVSREDDWVKILTFENPLIFNSQYIIDKLGL